MKKIAFVLVSALALSSCGPTVTDKQEQTQDMEAVQGSLPDGCVLHYAGAVRVEGFRETRPSRIFYTVCGDTVTTSQTNSVQQGKITVDQNDVSVTTK